MARQKGATAENTRKKILDCAESLFAERGIAEVSLREIARASGQKNVAVAHYYFGTKEDLIRAIFEYRMESFDAKRIHYLDALTAKGDDQDLREILVAFVRPLAEQLNPGLGRLGYLQFQLQVRVFSESLYNEVVLEGLGSGVAEGIRMTYRVLHHMPERVVRRRITLATELLLFSLADRARRIESGESSADTTAAFVRDLIDALFGLLTAPVSTAKELSADKLGCSPESSS